MSKFEKKEEIVVYGEDAVALLHQIIAGITNAQSDQPAKHPIDFSKLKKLKLSVKSEFGRPYVKCKVKYEGENKMSDLLSGDEISERQQPDFKSIKKRMDKSFKAIGERLKNGGLPSNLELSFFCDNSELMTGFPGYGDMHYPAFRQLIAEFREAFHQYDLESCRDKHAQIKVMKNTCHRKV
jgi:XXXCH domain-containing protein